LESGVTAKNQVSRKASKRKQILRRLLRWGNVDSIKSDPFHSALMKKIHAADLKQKVAQTIDQSMWRFNAKHMEVHVSGPFQNKKWNESLDCCSWQ
jgi:hypothetical protein